jgi:hypothetical protein
MRPGWSSRRYEGGRAKSLTAPSLDKEDRHAVVALFGIERLVGLLLRDG